MEIDSVEDVSSEDEDIGKKDGAVLALSEPPDPISQELDNITTKQDLSPRGTKLRNKKKGRQAGHISQAGLLHTKHQDKTTPPLKSNV